jgi:hypothetical protein
MGNCFLYKRGGGFGGTIPDIFKAALGKIIFLSDSKDAKLKGLRVFGKTTQNGPPSPEAPVPLESVGESVNVTVCGKNFAIAEITTPEHQGVTLTLQNDGNILLNGTSNAHMWIRLAVAQLVAGKTYTLSAANELGLTVWDGIANAAVATKNTPDRSVVFTVQNTQQYVIAIHNPAGMVFNNTLANIQIELGSKATTYEPYKEPQTLTISTPNGLPGIPVSSGGNYTDENGQQWVCDEVDFARGKYVQRIRKVILKNLTTGYMGAKVFHAEFTTGFPAKPAKANGEKADIMCDSLPVKSSNDQYNYGGSCVALSNIGIGYISFEGMTTLAQVNAILAEKDITIMYILAEENPISLTVEQLAAYAELHTNYPNTTIYNDAGAYMEVKYTAIGG